MFQELESHLQSEIDTLGYPQAALFGFCVALTAYNVLAVVKAALRQVHGEEKIRNDVSGYYLAGDISRTHEGMTVVVDPEEWAVFQTMTQQLFVSVLIQLAQNVQLEKYKKHRRCEIPAHRSHFVFGIKAPLKFRLNGATEIPA